MNRINPTRLEMNTARYNSAVAQSQVRSVERLNLVTEANKNKQQFKTNLTNDTIRRQDQSAKPQELLLSRSNLYRANLLNMIVNKMSGLENDASPGQYLEYYV